MFYNNLYLYDSHGNSTIQYQQVVMTMTFRDSHETSFATNREEQSSLCGSRHQHNHTAANQYLWRQKKRETRIWLAAMAW